MTLNDKFNIKITAEFKEDLEKVYNYIFLNLHSKSIADNLYSTVIHEISSLQTFPERFSRVTYFKYPNINIRKFLIFNYLVIYQVNRQTHQVNILHIFHQSQNYFNLL